MSLHKWKIIHSTKHDGENEISCSNRNDDDDNNKASTLLIHKEANRPIYKYSFARSFVQGIPHPPFITQKIWDKQRQVLTFRPSDIFVCTYSKCGTTLMEQIVLLLMNGGDASVLNPLHKNTLDVRCPGKGGKIWPEMAVVKGLLQDDDNSASFGEACNGENKACMTVEEFDALPGARVLKTHAPREIFLGNSKGEDSSEPMNKGNIPMVKGPRVIYVSRNPFDACVSCYYHPKPGISPASTGCPFDAFAKLWLSDWIEFGGWSNHVNGWRKEFLKSKKMWTASEDGTKQQILWTSFEELITNPRTSILKVADFLGIDYCNDNNRDNLVERVMVGCKFDNVKKAANSLLSSGMNGDSAHLRKGIIGDWRNHFTDGLRSEFESELRCNLSKGLDLSFDIGGGKVWSCAEEPLSITTEAVRFIDVKIVASTIIFYNILQMILSYVNEFYADEQRGKNGLPNVVDFPVVTVVVANIFNGVSGGLALSTLFYSWDTIYKVWATRTIHMSIVDVHSFFISIVFESLVTSGVLHSVGHRLFSMTFEGNAWVELISHLGYTLNVLFTGVCTISWLGSQHDISQRIYYCPIWYEVSMAFALATIAFISTLLWIPFEPDPYDFDYPRGSPFDKGLILLLQAKVQQYIEAFTVIPSVLLLFKLRLFWKLVRKEEEERSLSRSPPSNKLRPTAHFISILAVAIPLSLNWLHFRCHDSLVHSIQISTGWNHSELIAAIRLIFHIPNWILAILRLHYFRRLTEEIAGWPSLNLIEIICPGGEIFPFLTIFLYRASEGMTLALLPSFFQEEFLEDAKFHLDITDNLWVAVTVLGMFVANAIGAKGLGHLMQLKGYRFSFIFVLTSYAVLTSLLMIPYSSNASLLTIRSIASLIFPGPVMLSRITQLTHQVYTGAFTFVPMVAALVWFNQGFWFGGAISNSSAWTATWNVFFVSAFVLFVLACCILISFFVYSSHDNADCEKQIDIPHKTMRDHKAPVFEDGAIIKIQSAPSKEIATSSLVSNDVEGGILSDARKVDNAVEERMELLSESNVVSSSLWREKIASFVNGTSFACHISLLGIQITQLVDIDLYEYTTIVGSLGSMSTILILLSFAYMSRQRTFTSMIIAYCGHFLGTAVLSIPLIYSLQPRILAVFIIAVSYGVVLISFFVMNLSCEVSLGRKSIGNKALAAGQEMGNMKSLLSVGKVFGSILVVFLYRIHPQSPLWTLEAFLLVSLATYAFVDRRRNEEQ